VPSGLLDGVERLVVISKGHCSPAFYVWLSEIGVLDEEVLGEFAKPGSPLPSHLEAGTIPGIITSTGSLGQGLSIANGIALAARIDGARREVAVLLGDGELDEGQVWEAASTAGSLRLDNVVAVVDRNMHQHSGPTESVKKKEPLGARWASFGWEVFEADNSVASIVEALRLAGSRQGRPKVVIVKS